MVDKNFAYFIVDVYDADNIIVTLFSKWWNIGAIAQWIIFTEKELKDIVIKKVKNLINNQIPSGDILLELVERFKIEERS